MTFSSLDQLKSRTWKSLAEATAELKRNGFKARGADYEVREFKQGSWQIMPLEEGAEPAPVKDVGAAASGFSVVIRLSAKKRIDETAKTKDEAIAIAARLNAEHKGKRATIYTVPKSKKGTAVVVPYDDAPIAIDPFAEAAALAAEANNTKRQKANGAHPPKVEEKPAETAEPTGNDLSPVPEAGGPYHLRLPLGPQFDLAQLAERIAVKVDDLIEIVDPKGKVVRTIDHRLAVKPARATRSGTKQPRDTGKSADAVKLLSRPNGATKAEVIAITGWTFGDSYIARLAKSNSMTMETIAKGHWRLRSA